MKKLQYLIYYITGMVLLLELRDLFYIHSSSVSLMILIYSVIAVILGIINYYLGCYLLSFFNQFITFKLVIHKQTIDLLKNIEENFIGMDEEERDDLYDYMDYLVNENGTSTLYHYQLIKNTAISIMMCMILEFLIHLMHGLSLTIVIYTSVMFILSFISYLLYDCFLREYTITYFYQLVTKDGES